MAAGGEAGKPAANRSCGFCIRAIKYLPVVFLSVVIGWSYYAYTIQLCFRTVTSNVERIFYLLGYHVSLFIFLWSYWQTIATESGKVPSQFRLPYSELEKLEAAKNEQAQRQILERFASTLPVTNRTVTGAVRFCEKCQHVKPDRAHHCSVCGTCVLKMDHHCPWVNNCVSFTNYKFFILFLGYALIYCLFIMFTTLQYCIMFWEGEIRGIGSFNIVFLFFAAVMFAVSLLSLFCYHCYLILHNRTTLEAFRAPLFAAGADRDGFSLGPYSNFQEIFGDNRKTWFLPVFTSLGDGITYPVRSQHQANYNSMGSTENSLGDGVTYPRRAVDEDCHYLLGGQQWEEDNDVQSASYSGGKTDLQPPASSDCHPGDGPGSGLIITVQPEHPSEGNAV